jgi:anti-sigma B factor antagonist
MAREGATARMRTARGGVRRCHAAGRGLVTAVVGRDGRSVVLSISGEIDVHTAGELRTILFTLIEDGHTHLVCDFTDVRFCDAAGLGALVAANNRLRERGGGLRLVGVAPAQRRILEITRLDQLFRPFDSVDGTVAT